MANGRTAQRWLKWTPQTTRSRGRPRRRWMDDIKQAVERHGTNVQDTEHTELFLGRQEWRHFFADVLSFLTFPPLIPPKS